MDKLRALLTAGPGRAHRPVDLAATVTFVIGGALLIWSAAVHFHLWSETDGYRTIATIGPLFLLQSIAGLVIGIGVVVVRRLWAALIGLGFALTTVAEAKKKPTHSAKAQKARNKAMVKKYKPNAHKVQAHKVSKLKVKHAS